jgi:phage antirepressor YoqD-like protein
MTRRAGNDYNVLSVTKVADVLNVSTKCLNRWIAENRVFAIRKNRSRYVPRKEMERLLTGRLRPVRPVRRVK